MRKASPKPVSPDVLEVRVANLEQMATKLDKMVSEIKDNHLAHLALQMSDVQHTLNGIKDKIVDVEHVKEQLNRHDSQLKVASALWKSLLILAVFLLPSTLHSLIAEVKDFLHF